MHLHGLRLSGFRDSAVVVEWEGAEVDYQSFLRQPDDCPEQVVLSQLDLEDNMASQHGELGNESGSMRSAWEAEWRCAAHGRAATVGVLRTSTQAEPCTS